MKLFGSLLLIAFAGLTACGGGSTPPQMQISVLTNQLTIDYGGFKLLSDCDLKSAIRFEYKLDRDTAISADRPHLLLIRTYQRIVVNGSQPTAMQALSVVGILVIS